MRNGISCVAFRAMLTVTAAQAAAPWAGAVDELWQAQADGLAEGTSRYALVLGVECGASIELFTGGGASGGWVLNPHARIPLGTICLPDAATPESIETYGDWSVSRARATFAGDVKVNVHASTLSPGVAIETSGDRLRLFAGEHPQAFRISPQYGLRFYDAGGGPKRKITPPYVALPSARGVRAQPTVGLRPEENPLGIEDAPGVVPPDQAWMLVWWNDESHFGRTPYPVGGKEHSEAYIADCPLLLVFDQAPISIAAAEEGGLDIRFRESGRSLVIFPLMGVSHPRAADTKAWGPPLPGKGLPGPGSEESPLLLPDVVARIRALEPLARAYPLSVREQFRYDPEQDEAVFTEKVGFLQVGDGGQKFVPLPPLAAVAMQEGFPITAQEPLVDANVLTDFGPLVGAVGTDTLSWKIRGLGKYVNDRRVTTPDGRVPADLEAELRVRVQDMLDAGMLRPWGFQTYLPMGDSKGQYYWAEPGEVLALLAEIHGAASGPQQAGLVGYMKQYCESFPPESVPLIPDDAGASGGGMDIGPSRLTKAILEQRGQTLELFSLYGLERYLTLSGERLAADEWVDAKQILEDALREQGWAFLCTLVPRAREGTVLNANRDFAGAVGAIRLARRMSDSEAEQRAWWLFARTALLRHACGTYAAWRYHAGLFLLPPEPDWYWKLHAGSMYFWSGRYMETMDWSEPADDIRRIVRLGPAGVALSDLVAAHRTLVRGIGPPGHVPFYFDMVPELARFMEDHLKEEARVFVDRMAWYHPMWYAAFSEAVVSAEVNMNQPSDAYEAFMVRAQVLDAAPEDLVHWLDVPYVRRGDLFYMNKLAETIKQYRGVKWASQDEKRRTKG